MYKNILKGIIYIPIGIIFLFVIYHLVSAYFYSTENDNLLKIYYIGGVISGVFAFAAFFVAVYANSIQNRTGKLQRFENTFFSMLNLQQQITNDLLYNEDGLDPKETDKCKKMQGRELFQYFWEVLTLRSLYHEASEGEEEDTFGYEASPFEYRSGLKGLLEDFGSEEYDYQKIPTYFDHYFCHLYTIIKFVHNTGFLDWKERYKYTSIVRATLSRYELVWVYYNCLYGAGYEKFKPLVEEYALLKNIREDLLALCKKNKEILNNQGKISSFKKSFSGTDYEFYLSTENNTDKYYVGAFYSKDEISKGKELIKKWSLFLSK